MVRLVRAEKMVLSGLVFARKIARMILIQNIQGLLGPLMINMAFMPLYMWEMWDVTPVTHEHTNGQWESRAVFSLSWIRKITYNVSDFKLFIMWHLRECRVLKTNELWRLYWQPWRTLLIVSARNAKRPIINMSKFYKHSFKDFFINRG